MCQGCNDIAEYQAILDKHIEAELPKMLARPLDITVLYGPKNQRLAQDYAAKFMDKTRTSTVRVHPTDEHLRLAFSRSVRPPSPELFPLIREVIQRDWT